MIQIFRTGNSAIYCLNANVVWSTYNNKKEFAKFKANVIISKKEQEIQRERIRRISLKKKE